VKIFCINLPRSRDRRDFQRKQAANHGLEINFLEAIDYKNLSESDLQRAAQCWTRPIVGKDVGCFRSHKAAWQKISSSSGLCMVIEDDIVFSHSIASAVGLIEAQHSDPFAVYDLEYAPRKHLLGKEQVWRVNGITARELYVNKCGAGCYVLSPLAAKRLLAEVDEYAMVDSWLWTRPWINKIQIEPCPAAQIRDLTNNPQFEAATSGPAPVEYSQYNWFDKKRIRLRLTMDQAKSAIKGLMAGEKRDLIVDRSDFEISES